MAEARAPATVSWGSQFFRPTQKGRKAFSVALLSIGRLLMISEETHRRGYRVSGLVQVQVGGVVSLVYAHHAVPAYAMLGGSSLPRGEWPCLALCHDEREGDKGR